MAKIFSNEKIPKRFDRYVTYLLDEDTVIREISGFTSDALLYDAHYEKCRMNASEFGRVSSLCKEMRLLLGTVLPKAYNLSVTNMLVKKMRDLLEYDRESSRGERQLWRSFLTDRPKELMTGYNFIPEHPLPFRLKEGFGLTSDGCVHFSGSRFIQHFDFPEGSNSLGIRVHHLDFDFKTYTGLLLSSNWLFLRKGSKATHFELELPFPTVVGGVLFTLLEIQFFASDEGEFITLQRNAGVILHVLRIA